MGAQGMQVVQVRGGVWGAQLLRILNNILYYKLYWIMICISDEYYTFTVWLKYDNEINIRVAFCRKMECKCVHERMTGYHSELVPQ